MSDSIDQRSLDTATLAGGCFWCLEAGFNAFKGVESVTSGYSGGHIKNPSYKEVCQGTTGHAEAVQIRFLPEVIPYTTLLEIFWTIHDPTTLNRQGGDIGTQYRSAVFFHNEEQKKLVEQSIEEVAAPLWGRPIVTEVVPFEVFYPAEDYHHDYFAQNPNTSYCQIIIDPKVRKVREKFSKLLK